jgi:hypothetical protein
MVIEKGIVEESYVNYSLLFRPADRYRVDSLTALTEV